MNHGVFTILTYTLLYFTRDVRHICICNLRDVIPTNDQNYVVKAWVTFPLME